MYGSEWLFEFTENYIQNHTLII